MLGNLRARNLVPVEVVLGNSVKMFPSVVALIFMNLEMDSELDEVPTIVSVPSLVFSGTGRSMRRSFLEDKTK